MTLETRPQQVVNSRIGLPIDLGIQIGHGCLTCSIDFRQSAITQGSRFSICFGDDPGFLFLSCRPRRSYDSANLFRHC